MTPTWQSECGRVQLWCGDCREILPLFGNVDAVVTDPPYGVNLKNKTSRYSTSHKTESYCDLPHVIEGTVIPAIRIAIRIAARTLVTPGTRSLLKYPQPDSIGTIFSPGAGGGDRWGFGCNNPILYYGVCPYMAKGRGGRPNSFASNRADPYEPSEKSISHPCPKPVAWMIWLVVRGSLTGETILDPFMGSGTTAIACLRTGRKFIGIEIEPRYFQIAKERIQRELAQGVLALSEEPAPEQGVLV